MNWTLSGGLALIYCGLVGVILTHALRETWHAAFSKDSQMTVYRWALVGWGLPMGLFLVANAGFIPGFPPLFAIPGLGLRNGFERALIAARPIPLLSILGAWTTVTLGWVFVKAWETANQAARSSFNWRKRTIVGVLAGALLWGFCGYFGMSIAGLLLFWLLLDGITQGASNPVNQPIYAKATSYQNFGKFDQAELEIVEQLEKSPEDFKGWWMLAEIYAKRRKDLKSAHETVIQLAHQDNVCVFDKCRALNTLADWHLDLADNPKAARAALRTIIDLFPRTRMAQEATIRMESLPANHEAALEAKKPKTVLAPRIEEPDIRTLVRNRPGSGGGLPETEPSSVSKEDQDRIREIEMEAQELASDRATLGDALRLVDSLIERASGPIQWTRWIQWKIDWELKWNGAEGVLRALMYLEEIQRKYPKTQYALNASKRAKRIRFEAEQKGLLQPNAAGA